MSVVNNKTVINVLDTTSHENITLDLDNEFEDSDIMAFITIRDLKILDFIKECLEDNHGASIYKGYKL